MKTFIYTIDEAIATIQYDHKADNFATEFNAVLEDTIALGAKEILLDKGDITPSTYSDALAAGKEIAGQLVHHGVRLAVILRDDDHETKIALAAASQEGAAVMIGKDRGEAYAWLKGQLR
ncbi:MAG: hypothetical protein AAGI89_13500 [Pseudomonadota bacterium]